MDTSSRITRTIIAAALSCAGPLWAEKKQLPWPPALPGAKKSLTFSSPGLLKPTETLREGVRIAGEAPRIDFLFYDCQTYPGKPWSNWGDGTAVGDKYYSAIGDHKSPEGNAFVYEYDSKTGKLRLLTDLRAVLKRPPGHYTPGKIHSRIDLGSDGWLYFSTHRGSTRIASNPEAHFKGDWILRHHPRTGSTEIVAAQPLPMQCMPAGLLDPDRLIFYAGTADGLNRKPPQLLAYDVRNRRVLYTDGHGFSRCAIFARSTGRLYFHGGSSSPNRAEGACRLVRFDPARPGRPAAIDAAVGLRAATMELPDNMVYTIDHDRLWAFNTKTEKAKDLGPSAAGSKTYTTSIDADPETGRYLYYVPGAHGGSERDGSPVVQYDLRTKTRKVIAFLHPELQRRTGYVPIGTFSTAVSPGGDRVYVTWNGCRSEPGERPRRYPFESCAMTVIHIPASERRP